MKNKVLASIIIFLLIFAALPPFLTGVEADDVVAIGDLTVHFIDVGQGDSCFVELPDGRNMLVDAGTSAYGKTVESYINDNIKDEDGNSIKFIDFVIFTHSDADHIGGMSYVLSKFDVGTLYRSNEECLRCADPAKSGVNERNRFWGERHGEKNTKAFHEAIERAYDVADEVIVLNPEDETQNKIESTSEKYYSINFYSPLGSFYTDLNNYSPIMVIEYMGRRIVLSGDAEKQNESEFVERAKAGEGKYSIFDGEFCADVIKLGHHGSRTSSSEDYLNVMAAGSGRKNVLVVISCGQGNSYGHPHEEVLLRLKNMGFDPERILRTDLVGDIVITIAEQNGIFKAFCIKGGSESTGESSSGSSGESENPGSVGSESTGGNENESAGGILDKFNGLPLVYKIVIAAVVVLIVVIVISTLLPKKRRKRRKR